LGGGALKYIGEALLGFVRGSWRLLRRSISLSLGTAMWVVVGLAAFIALEALVIVKGPA
jgi:hypothetical protein